MNNDDLKYAIENGIINLSHIQEQIEMNKREEILKEYRGSIRSFDNREEATKQLLELRKNETYKNAWLLAK